MCSITEMMSDQWFSTMLPILVIEHEFYLLQLYAYEFLKKKKNLKRKQNVNVSLYYRKNGIVSFCT